jgi:hypothetical protein
MLSVGSIFSKERRRRELTLKDVERHTRIREKFLESIERNDWSEFSSKIYITGIIKNYAKFLDLDPDKMIAYFRRDYERLEEGASFKRRVESKYFKSETRRVIMIGIVLIILGFAGYFGFQLKNYLEPPGIAIVSPTTTVILGSDRVRITGKTEPDATVVIFEDRVYQNEEGIFQYDFPLKEGSNNLVIEVTGANGRTSRLEKTFVRE